MLNFRHAFIALLTMTFSIGVPQADQRDWIAAEAICLARPVQSGSLSFDIGHAPISRAKARQSEWHQSLAPLARDQIEAEARTSIPELDDGTVGSCVA